MKVFLLPTQRWSIGGGHSKMHAGEDERAKREETARRFVSRSGRWSGALSKQKEEGKNNVLPRRG